MDNLRDNYTVHCTSGREAAIVGQHYAIAYNLYAVLTSAWQHNTWELACPCPCLTNNVTQLTSVVMYGRRPPCLVGVVGASCLTIANLLQCTVRVRPPRRQLRVSRTPMQPLWLPSATVVATSASLPSQHFRS